MLKLAHDEALKAASPGTVLTALILRNLLDEDHVAEIDFGRGDDPYKSAWAGVRRRQRIGLILANKLHPRGLAFLGRHAMGRVRASLLRGPIWLHSLRILYSHRIQSRDGQSVHVEALVAALRELGHDVLVVGPGFYEQAEFGGESSFVAALPLAPAACLGGTGGACLQRARLVAGAPGVPTVSP